MNVKYNGEGDLASVENWSQVQGLQCGFPATAPETGDYLTVPDTLPTPPSGQGYYYVTAVTYQGQTRYGRQASGGGIERQRSRGLARLCGVGMGNNGDSGMMIVGVLQAIGGIGATIAAILAWNVAKRNSEREEALQEPLLTLTYTKGGVIPESHNHSTIHVRNIGGTSAFDVFLSGKKKGAKDIEQEFEIVTPSGEAKVQLPKHEWNGPDGYVFNVSYWNASRKKQKVISMYGYDKTPWMKSFKPGVSD